MFQLYKMDRSSASAEQPVFLNRLALRVTAETPSTPKPGNHSTFPVYICLFLRNKNQLWNEGRGWQCPRRLKTYELGVWIWVENKMNSSTARRFRQSWCKRTKFHFQRNMPKIDAVVSVAKFLKRFLVVCSFWMQRILPWQLLIGNFITMENGNSKNLHPSTVFIKSSVNLILELLVLAKMLKNSKIEKNNLATAANYSFECHYWQTVWTNKMSSEYNTDTPSLWITSN